MSEAARALAYTIGNPTAMSIDEHRAWVGVLERRIGDLIDEAVRRAREERDAELASRTNTASPPEWPLPGSVHEVKEPSVVFRSVKVQTYGSPFASVETDPMPKELEETPRPELAPAPSSPPDEGRPLTDPLQVPDMVYVMVTRQGDTVMVGRSLPEVHLTDRDIRMGYRVVEYVRGDLHATAIRERDEARAEVERLKHSFALMEQHANNWQEEADAATIAREAETERADKLMAELEKAQVSIADLERMYMKERATRPAMGPIPEEVCDKAAEAERRATTGSRRGDMCVALDAVRADLCQHEVVQTANPMWADKSGVLWHKMPTEAQIVKAFGPFTPVLLVRDHSREVVK